MNTDQYLDLIKLCASIALLTLASLIASTGLGTSTASTLDPASAAGSPASKRGRILREDALPDRRDPVDSHFLDYEIGSKRASGRGSDMT